MSEGQVLLFRAGGLRLGVFLAEVGKLLVEDVLVPVPFSHPAMAGLIVAEEDGPVPVFDLRGLADIVEINAGRSPMQRTVALFPTAKGPVGLRLEELLGTVAVYEALGGQATEDLHINIPAPLLTTITGAARTADGPFSFFSPEAFLAGLGL